jgi:uncharacterized protein
MEEILASIRRIIADDEAGEPNSKPAPSSMTIRADTKNRQNDANAGGFDAAQEPDDPAGAEVTGDVIAPGEATPANALAFNGIDHATDAVLEGALGSERPRAPQEPGAMPDRPLLSPRTTAAVDTAFSSLTHTVLMQNPRTIEDLVREMLKPMLKAWLDDNLPNMVERLVRAEIERVSRGRG